MTINSERVRAGFHALRRTVDGHPAIYLDGPAGSQFPDTVVDAMSFYMRNAAANTGGYFITSMETDMVVHAAREAAADLLCCDARQVAFGPNMTTLNFLLAHAVSRTMKRGDEIIITSLDHDANISPWLQMARDYGFVIKQLPLDAARADLDYGALEKALTPKTRIVAFTLASNAIGTIPDARRISDLAHRVGALAWTDAVHFAPHRRMKPSEIGCDVLVCSAYKFCGPHLGIAYLRDDLARAWPADRVRPASEEPPGHRFETGTGNFEALAGFVACVDYLANLGGPDGRASRLELLDRAFENINNYESKLSDVMLQRLSENRRVTVHGHRTHESIHRRTPTFAITDASKSPGEMSKELAHRGIFTWAGHYYALEVMAALGLSESGGALRVGLLHYSTESEVHRFCDTLAEITR